MSAASIVVVSSEQYVRVTVPQACQLASKACQQLCSELRALLELRTFHCHRVYDTPSLLPLPYRPPLRTPRSRLNRSKSSQLYMCCVSIWTFELANVPVFVLLYQ
jgi:hypothetical protein